MRHRQLIWFCAAALMATIWIYCGSGEDADPAAKKPVFSVAFQGYSNGPSGRIWAVLQVTNSDTCDLHFLIPMMLVDSNGLDPMSMPTHVSLGANPLHRGDSCGLAVDISRASNAWRFWCPVTRHTRRYDLEARLPHPFDRCVPGEPGGEMGEIDTGWRLQQVRPTNGLSQ